MKKNILATVIIIAFTLTGCNNLNNISDQNYNAIADYMASMILKYDRSYEEKLFDPTVIAEAAMVDKVLDLNVGDSQEDKLISSDAANVTDVIDGLVEAHEEIEKVYNLTEVLGFSKFDIQYVNYKLYDSFPEESDNEYFNLEAGKNTKLCVILFDIKNKTSKKENFNLLNKEINYQLDVDSNSYTPLLTLIVNDLQFIDISIDGEKSKKGYLVFEVSKDIKLDNANLVVSRDSLKSSIALK